MKLVLPDWLALMVQVPVVTKPIKPPLVMVHTLLVAEVKIGVNPDVAVAVSVGVVPNTRPPGLAKPMVWVAFWHASQLTRVAVFQALSMAASPLVLKPLPQSVL